VKNDQALLSFARLVAINENATAARSFTLPVFCILFPGLFFNFTQRLIV